MIATDSIARMRLTPTPKVYGYTELLTPDGYNPKLKHGRDRGYSSAILHLAPAVLSGYEVCASRSIGCTASCLNTAGHGGIALDASGLNAPVRTAAMTRPACPICGTSCDGECQRAQRFATTTTCVVCHQVVNLRTRPPNAIAVHFLDDGTECPGSGPRPAPVRS